MELRLRNFHWSKENNSIQEVFELLRRAIHGPTISYEDNNAAIQQIQVGQLAPRVKHFDIMMIWLHEQYQYK